ncbi:MAG: hypothetical protein K2Q01_05540 [Rickettsiales bacterium]|nr:hypothetical protein [Rickettsiales bacterium]
MSDAGEFLIEFHVVGRSVKVTAVDTETMREASIVASPLLSREMLARQAVRKLQYVLRKRAKPS